MQTLDVIAKEYRHKAFGNSYFSAQVTIDFGLKTEKTYYLPFQYGYEETYLQETKAFLVKSGILASGSGCLSVICRDNGIILRYGKQTNCKKSEVEAFGKEPKHNE